MAKNKEAAKGLIKVRVLVDCEVGKCNTLAEIDASQLQALAGKVDDSPEAVAFVEAQGE